MSGEKGESTEGSERPAERGAGLEPRARATSGEGGRRARGRWWSSLSAKSAGLLTLAALAPLGLAVASLSRLGTTSVERVERELSAAAIADVAAESARLVGSARADADAIAAALAEAAHGVARGGDGLDGVRALLATRRTIAAVRFEVPEARVDQTLRRADTSVELPSSTADLRSAADARGFGLAIDERARATLVVPIPRPPEGDQRLPRGYVTTTFDLDGLDAALVDAAQRKFSGGVKLVVLDGSARVVSSLGDVGKRRGELASDLPVLRVLPEVGVRAPSTRVAVVSEHDEAGALQVGVVETVPSLGFTVALWRPRDVAFATLTELRRRTLGVTAGALVFALLLAALSSRALSAPLARLRDAARALGARRYREVALPTERGDELGDVARAFSTMRDDLEASEATIAHEARLRRDLGRFLAKELVEAIVAGEHPLALGGKRVPISVLFADVVAFTPLAESRPAEEVVALLNELFGVLSEVVFRHGGTVDKFIGDCIMAVWGAPLPAPDHAARAVAAAEDMMRFLEASNETFRERYGVELRLGIGIHSGEAIAGNIGGDKRMEYTVVGDVVNVAARLETIAKPNQVLVSAVTRDAAGDFPFRFLGKERLTGRTQETDVYELDLG